MPTPREMEIELANKVHAAANPPHGPNRTHTDYAAIIASNNPVTLLEAQRLRKQMIQDADTKAQREQIAAAFMPVLERLQYVE